jgi:AAA ATPase domain
MPSGWSARAAAPGSALRVPSGPPELTTGSADADADERHADPGPQPLGTLMGRARELTEFEPTLAQVRSERGRTVDLVGEPGIAKSRLLAALGRRAEERALLVLHGRAAECEPDPSDDSAHSC